jgi:hypothetical protein
LNDKARPDIRGGLFVEAEMKDALFNSMRALGPRGVDLTFLKFLAKTIILRIAQQARGFKGLDRTLSSPCHLVALSPFHPQQADIVHVGSHFVDRLQPPQGPIYAGAIPTKSTFWAAIAFRTSRFAALNSLVH